MIALTAGTANARKSGSEIAALVLGAAGSGVTILGLATLSVDGIGRYPHRISLPAEPYTIAGVTMISVGFVSALTGLVLKLHPVSIRARRVLQRRLLSDSCSRLVRRRQPL